MPVLAISAVDHTTGLITITAHGRATGDGPAALYTPNGALPTGWSPVTDYWLIRVDANTMKLASSSSNAMAGTALALPSDNGSGTLQLLLGLPYRRPRTAAPGTQKIAADDNSTWDSLVALWNLLTGQAQAVFSGIVLATNQNLKLQGTGYVQRGNGNRLHPFTPGGDWQVLTGSPPAWSSPGTAAVVTIPASSSVFYPLRIESDKDRIQAVTVYGRAFVGAATMSLYLSSGIGFGAESLNLVNLVGGGTTISVPADGLYNPRTLTLQTPVAPTAGEMLMLRVDTAAGNTAGVISYGVVSDVP